MSNPTPTPIPTAPTTTAVDWAKLTALVLLVLSSLATWLAPPTPAPDPSPKPTPVVVVDPKPVVTPDVPVKPVVVVPVKPIVAPELWIIKDSTGRRITDSTLEKVAGSLKAGKWIAEGVPKPGEVGRALTITVDDGVKPIPPVEPEPPVKPDVPVPIPSSGFRVLILEESGNRTPELASLVATPDVATYLNTKCAKGAEGSPEWRKWDDDYTTEQQARWSDVWKAAYARAKADSAAAGNKLPWLMVSDGTKGESIPLTDATGKLISKSDFLALLKRYGG